MRNREIDWYQNEWLFKGRIKVTSTIAAHRHRLSIWVLVSECDDFGHCDTWRHRWRR